MAPGHGCLGDPTRLAARRCMWRVLFMESARTFLDSGHNAGGASALDPPKCFCVVVVAAGAGSGGRGSLLVVTMVLLKADLTGGVAGNACLRG
eukprot:jgi/Chlat1/6092/Chrsp40S05685